MALIKTVPADQADGKVKEIYDMMMEKARVIPKPFQLMSASPDLLALQFQSLNYYFKHPNFGFEQLAYIRFLTAHHFKYEY